MPGNNNQNNVNNRTNFASGSDVSSRHQNLAKQNPQPSPSANDSQYLNPNNFRQILGQNEKSQPAAQQAPLPPQPQQPVKTSTPPASPVSQQKATSEQDIHQEYLKQLKTASIPAMPTQEILDKKLINQKEANAVKGNETLKLVVYIIPIIGIFILVLRSVTNKEVMWHVRQSLVAQAIWFAVLIVLRLLDLPIISDVGATLWNAACYILLVIAGVQAYNNQRFNIPVAYDIAKDFIEGKE